MFCSHQITFGNIVRRILLFFGLTVFVLAVSLPPANAAQRKRQVIKASKSTVVTKRRVSKTVGVVKRKSVVRAEAVSLHPSFGQIAGLHGAHDALDLKSSVALVIDQDTSEVLFSKNDQAVLPIASLTKLMTGVVVSEAHLPMDEVITISQADVDTEKGSSSRLRVGTELSRGELLHLALMSSENRAAHALGRTYPGGLPVFVGLMNAKARLIGMNDTNYVEPTGLSSKNQSSARDLVKLVNVAYGDPTLRELSTSPGHQVAVGNRTLQYNNTNRLVKNPSWDIGLQKTGYINEAGQCLVMQAKVAGRKLIMVFLDSAGKLSRIGDAERVRHWVESIPPAAVRAVPLASAVTADKVATLR
ncbi:D-alanyl-D-alanine endopeptidase [Rhodoferax sp. UBA5149]|uniref:D-alanyl-D-alanine endopeptidase n=1 Tax=Rhodoferax sp. UBA5149 TaxID=1947379 RepID=UPI0025E2DA19|nr:D-alanyl-D-alanine endopeptidase [Rhodoferax sp. UBA5149]